MQARYPRLMIAVGAAGLVIGSSAPAAGAEYYPVSDLPATMNLLAVAIFARWGRN